MIRRNYNSRHRSTVITQRKQKQLTNKETKTRYTSSEYFQQQYS